MLLASLKHTSQEKVIFFALVTRKSHDTKWIFVLENLYFHSR